MSEHDQLITEMQAALKVTQQEPTGKNFLRAMGLFFRWDQHYDENAYHVLGAVFSIVVYLLITLC